MQDVDRIHDVEGLAQPPRAQRLRVQAKADGLVPRPQHPNGIVAPLRWSRHVRQKSPVRPAESQLAVRLSYHLKSFLVNGTVMPPTQHCEVRESGRPTLGPVTDVMPLAERDSAPRKPAPAVAMVQRAPDRRRNRPRPRADF